MGALRVPVPVQPAARETPPVTAPLPPPAAVSPPTPVPSVTPKAEEKGISTGTGFFVDAKGNLITNAHVVKDCKVVVVKLMDGKPAHKARVVATDTSNDLALLTVEDAVGTKFASLRMGTRLGEGVAVFGYPHADIQRVRATSPWATSQPCRGLVMTAATIKSQRRPSRATQNARFWTFTGTLLGSWPRS